MVCGLMLCEGTGLGGTRYEVFFAALERVTRVSLARSRCLRRSCRSMAVARRIACRRASIPHRSCRRTSASRCGAQSRGPGPVPEPCGLVVKNASKIRGNDSGGNSRSVIRDADRSHPGSRVASPAPSTWRSRSVPFDGDASAALSIRFVHTWLSAEPRVLIVDGEAFKLLFHRDLLDAQLVSQDRERALQAVVNVQFLRASDRRRRTSSPPSPGRRCAKCSPRWRTPATRSIPAPPASSARLKSSRGSKILARALQFLRLESDLYQRRPDREGVFDARLCSHSDIVSSASACSSELSALAMAAAHGVLQQAVHAFQLFRRLRLDRRSAGSGPAAHQVFAQLRCGALGGRSRIVQLVHQARSQRSQRYQLLAMQRLHLVHLTAVAAMSASTTLRRRRAARHQGPELLARNRTRTESSHRRDQK